MQAKVNIDHDGALQQHIARMSMLCDLMLDTETNTSTHPISVQQETKQPDNEMMKEPASEEQNNEVTEDPYDIFDF